MVDETWDCIRFPIYPQGAYSFLRITISFIFLMLNRSFAIYRHTYQLLHSTYTNLYNVYMDQLVIMLLNH